MTDSSGNIQAQYHYDPYGDVSKIQGGLDSDFLYASYYLHSPSQLNLTLRRAYNSNLGRFVNRDPIMEKGGINLYCYVKNNPIIYRDPLGLMCCSIGIPPRPQPAPPRRNPDDDDEISCREQCFIDYQACKDDCYRKYKCPSPELDDCLSDCKAEYFRCLDNCKREGE